MEFGFYILEWEIFDFALSFWFLRLYWNCGVISCLLFDLVIRNRYGRYLIDLTELFISFLKKKRFVHLFFTLCQTFLISINTTTNASRYAPSSQHPIKSLPIWQKQNKKSKMKQIKRAELQWDSYKKFWILIG